MAKMREAVATNNVFRWAGKFLSALTQFEFPANVFWVDEAANLVFFVGKEPNLRWQSFADCIFFLAKKIGVSRIIFMGSFGGSVPHTREPRMYGSVSERGLLRRLGFVVEGYARDYLFLNGQWRDHVMTSLTNPDWRPE